MRENRLAPRRARAFVLALTATVASAACRKAPAANPAAENVMALGAVDQLPARQSGPALVYPPLLLDAGIEGHVEVDFVVRADGSVDTASLAIVSSSNQQFVPEARTAILASHYAPAQVAGKPVAVRLRQLVSFAIRRFDGSYDSSAGGPSAFTVIAQPGKR